DASRPKASRRTCRAASSPKAGGLLSRGFRRSTIGPKVILRSPGGTVRPLMIRSGAWDPHAGPRAVVPEQGEGNRCGTGVVDVSDRRPRVRGKAWGGGMVRDLPQRRDVRDATAAGDVSQQLLARLVPGDLDERWRGATTPTGHLDRAMGHLDRCVMAA